MRIDSMDAAGKKTINITQTIAKAETVSGPAKLDRQAGQEHLRAENYGDIEKLSDTFIKKAIERANHTFEIENRSLRFQIHEKLNEVMVKVIDSDTKEVIREIPPEKLLDMFASMLELAGLLVDEKR